MVVVGFDVDGGCFGFGWEFVVYLIDFGVYLGECGVGVVVEL